MIFLLPLSSKKDTPIICSSVIDESNNGKQGETKNSPKEVMRGIFNIYRDQLQVALCVHSELYVSSNEHIPPLERLDINH